MASITLQSAPAYAELRTCGDCCVDFGCAGNPFQDPLSGVVACSVNSCFCRSDIQSLALQHLSTCVKSQCSNDNDVTSYQSVYLAYCTLDHGNSYSTFTDAGFITGTGATGAKTVERTIEKTVAETFTSVTTTVETLIPTLATFSSLVTYSTTNPDGSVALITSTSATTAAVVTVEAASDSKSTISPSDKIALGLN
ncbi:hypothetical protein K458DRAFT_431807 [Lentithecium fluviatile CBS 122367]|uniref:Extracellular membrane protein CFEM domain-containing protein n=1 Tax=Lentithecium fluviatile CBS 122367 TaxID=1168545 RepID=A0A6G1IZJ0_9PLEO|nr:hypothetical protein K458DRAFT_431807 [Lentithecium fluviatile CBS 122367]